MVRHLVFFRLKDEALGQPKAQLMAEVVRRLQGLPPLIADIRELQVGADFLHSPASWDVGLYTVFADREALERYRVHPEHQKVVAYIAQVVAERAVVDWEDNPAGAGEPATVAI